MVALLQLVLVLGSSVGIVSGGALHKCPAGHEWSRLHGCLKCPKGNFGLGRTFCEMCPAGKYADKEGLASCATCPAGRYGYGASKTSACSGSCQGGRFGSPGCSTAMCSGPCDAGHYGTTSQASAACSGACPAGKFAKAGSKKCSRCDVGRYCARPGCGACRHCPAGKFAQGLGIRLCKSCPRGTSSNKGAQDSNDCKPCNGKHGERMYGGGCPGALGECRPGTYGDPGSTICKACPKGEYQFYPRQDHCVGCPRGRFAHKPGSRVCGDCPAGLWLHGKANAARCMPCPSGTYAKKHAVQPCVVCPPGKFSHTGSRGCKECPAGQYGVGASFSTFCSGPCAAGRWGKTGEKYRLCSHKCDAGRYGTVGQESRKCGKVCPGGKFNPVGGIGCKLCAAGKYAQPGAAFCRSCPIGQFKPKHASRCAACPSGKTTPRAGSPVCTAVTVSPTRAPTPAVPTPNPTSAPTPPTRAPTPRPTPAGTQALVEVHATATLSGPTITALQADAELAMSIKRAFTAGLAEALGVAEDNVELLKTTSDSSGMHIAFKADFTNDCPPSNTFCFRKTHPHYKKHVLGIINGSAFLKFLRSLLQKHGVDLSARELVLGKPRAISFMDVQKVAPAPTPRPTAPPSPSLPKRAAAPAPAQHSSYDTAVEISAAFLGVLGAVAAVAAWKERTRDDIRVVASAEEERHFAEEESTMFEVHGRETTGSADQDHLS